MQQQQPQCVQSSLQAESLTEPQPSAERVTTDLTSHEDPQSTGQTCDEHTVVGARDLLTMSKPPKKKPGRHAKIVQLAYADEINRRLPQNLRFYRILPSTDSSSFHIEKKSLSASDCSLVESVLGLRRGTCYVLWNWMKLKSITMSHSEWYKVAKNGKTEYVVQQSHLAYFQNTVLTTFEKEFAAYLQQPTIKDVYFVKVREKRGNQRGGAAQQRRARNVLPAPCEYPLLQQLPSMEGIHFPTLHDDGFLTTTAPHQMTPLYTHMQHPYTSTGTEYMQRQMSPTSAYLNVVSVEPETQQPQQCDTGCAMQYYVSDGTPPETYTEQQSYPSYTTGYGQQQQQQQLKVFTPVAVKSLSPIEGGLKLQQQLFEQHEDNHGCDQCSCSPPASDKPTSSPVRQPPPRIAQPLCGRDVVLMRSKRRASEQAGQQQTHGERNAKRQKCTEPAAVIQSSADSLVHGDAP